MHEPRPLRVAPPRRPARGALGVSALLLLALGRPARARRPRLADDGERSAELDGPEWRAFVLNLDRDPDRFAGFRSAVAEQEPWLLRNLQRISAVDGQALMSNRGALRRLLQKRRITSADLHRARQNADGSHGWSELSPGAVGLYLSHGKAWQRIVESGLHFGIVFEDDLRFFSSHFRHTVHKLLQQSANVTDLAYLQHCEDSSGWPRGLGYSGYTPIGHPSPRHVAVDEIVPCTAAYVLSRHAASQLLRRAFPMVTQLDRALSTYVSNATSGLRRVVYEPALAQVGPESFSSSVQQLSTCEDVKFRAASWVGMWIAHMFPC